MRKINRSAFDRLSSKYPLLHTATMGFAYKRKLTSLDNLAALPLALHHGKAGTVEHLGPDGFLQGLTDELGAGVGVLEIGHAGCAPVLHHFAGGSAAMAFAEIGSASDCLLKVCLRMSGEGKDDELGTTANFCRR